MNAQAQQSYTTPVLRGRALEIVDSLGKVRAATGRRSGGTQKHFDKAGLHPPFGSVKLSQLLSTWLSMTLTISPRYATLWLNSNKEDIGPWIEYLKVLKQ